MTTTKSFNLVNFAISMIKVVINEIKVGELFVPIQDGEDMFTIFTMKQKHNEGNIMELIGTRMDTGVDYIFCWTDRVVRAADKNNTTRKIQIVEVTGEENWGKTYGYDSNGERIYSFPMSIKYQVADQFGQFETIPSGMGMDIRSEEHAEYLIAWDNFFDALPSIECDFTDFLAFLQETTDWLIDFEFNTREGVATLKHEGEWDGEEGHYFVDFCEAYEDIEMNGIEDFVASRI